MATALIAPIGTKVAVYILIRTYMLSDFPPMSELITWLAAVGIIAGSVLAISQTDLIGLTVVVAILVALRFWLGAPIVMVILGGTAGGFVAALSCPYIGCDHVLDNIRRDILKCLALAAYLILGFWVALAAMRALVESVHGPQTPLFVTQGIVIAFFFTVVLLAKVLWTDNGKFEAAIVALGTMFGAFVLAIAVT